MSDEYEENTRKIWAISNAHGLFVPDLSNTDLESVKKIAAGYAYFDNQVRGLTDNEQGTAKALMEAQAELTALRDKCARLDVMMESFPGWVNTIAKTAADMISSLVSHHKFEHPVQQQNPAESDDFLGSSHSSGNSYPECSPLSSPQAPDDAGSPSQE